MLGSRRRYSVLAGMALLVAPSTTVLAADGGVQINEIESQGGSPGDWVELYNSSSSAIDVSSWIVKDNNDANAYTLPQGSVLGAAGYLLIEEHQLAFGLGAGDAVRLYNASGALVDSYAWAVHATNSYGRCPNGVGAFVSTTSTTKGTSNSCGVTPASCGNGRIDVGEQCDDGNIVNGDCCSATCGAEARTAVQFNGMTSVQLRPPEIVPLANGEQRWRTNIEFRNTSGSAVRGVELIVKYACDGPGATFDCAGPSSRMQWDTTNQRWTPSPEGASAARPSSMTASVPVGTEGSGLVADPRFSVDDGDRLATFALGDFAAAESRVVDIDWIFASSVPPTFFFGSSYLAHEGGCIAQAVPVPASSPMMSAMLLCALLVIARWMRGVARSASTARKA